MRPEQTQGGGFAGGVFTGPGAAPPRSSLFELAEALGTAGQQVVGGLVDDFGQRIETNKKAALDEAAVFEQTTAGYTSEMLGAELESEPMLAKFKANPYLMPAINVYRGRKLADELGLKMVQEGVNTGDAEAVQAFYQNNAPDLSDPFYARGFNEQNARLQAQFSQQQLKDAAIKAEEDAVAGAGGIWQQTFMETGDVNAAKAALDGSVFATAIDGKKLSAIQYEVAQQLAQEGNVELFNALVDTQRGDAPALAQTVGMRGDIALLRERVKQKRNQDMDGARNAATASLTARVNKGANWPSIESSPEYQMLATEGQKPGEMSNEQLSIWRAHDAKVQHEIRLTEINNANERLAAQIEGQYLVAAEMFNAGNAWGLEGFTATDPDTGRTETLSASKLREGTIKLLRTANLGENPYSLKGDDARRYGTYTSMLAMNNQHDPQLKAAINGMATSLSVEGLSENPEGALQAFEIYRNLGEDVRDQYVPEGRARTVLTSMVNELDRNPTLDPLVAARKAVTLAANPVRISRDSRSLGLAAATVKIPDARAPKRLFGGTEKFTPDKRQYLDFMQERASEYMSYGMSEPDAAEASRKDVENMFVGVNGVAVRAPEYPAGRGSTAAIPTAKEWGKVVYDWLDLYSQGSKIPAEELRVTWITGNTYSLGRVTTDEDGRVQVETIEEQLFVGDIMASLNSQASKAISELDKSFQKPAPTATPSGPETVEDAVAAQRQTKAEEREAAKERADRALMESFR